MSRWRAAARLLAESVTVTWSPAATPGRRPRFGTARWRPRRTLAPSLGELVAASARHLLERQQLPTAARALARSDPLS